MTQAGKVIAVTDTPLTDKLADNILLDFSYKETVDCLLSHARQLERQLAAATARAEAADEMFQLLSKAVDFVVAKYGECGAVSAPTSEHGMNRFNVLAAKRVLDKYAAIDEAQGSNP